MWDLIIISCIWQLVCLESLHNSELVFSMDYILCSPVHKVNYVSTQWGLVVSRESGSGSLFIKLDLTWSGLCIVVYHT
jgi:hypothetical protein